MYRSPRAPETGMGLDSARMVLSTFGKGGYEKGRSVWVQASWLLIQPVLVQPWFVPNRLRLWILRKFGAQIGLGVQIRHRVRIHWPWKLEVGHDSWIGEGAWILNLETVEIGSNTCISQDVLICTGSHQFDSHSFEYDNAPVRIGDRTWLGARATILRGVTIGSDTLIGATALVHRSVPSASRVLAPSTAASPRPGHDYTHYEER